MLGTEPLWRWRRHRRAARRKLEGLIAGAGLEVPLDAPVGGLSVGERQRVEILKALYRDVRVLILDEPTAVLTPQEAERLFATLDRAGRERASPILFISHKLDEVMRLCRRVAVLRAGRKVAEFPVRGHQPRGDRRGHGRPPGQPAAARRAAARRPGPGAARRRRARPRRRRGVAGVDLTVHAHEIVGIAGVSGNGQRALAGLLAGLAAPRGRRGAPGRAGPGRRAGRPPRSRPASAASPRTASARAWSPSCRSPEPGARDLPPPGLPAAGLPAPRPAGRSTRAPLIRAYDVRCEGPGQRVGPALRRQHPEAAARPRAGARARA